ITPTTSSGSLDIESGNRILKQVISTLYSISRNIRATEEEARTRIFPSLVVYGEGEPATGFVEGEPPEFIARMLPVMKDALSMSDILQTLVINAVKQIAALYHPRSNVMDVRHGVHFHIFFRYIAASLRLIVTLDAILVQHGDMLQNHWLIYKRTLTSTRSEPERFQIPVQQLPALGALLKSIESVLIEANCFSFLVRSLRTKLESDSQFQQSEAGSVSWKVLSDELLLNMRQMASQIEETVAKYQSSGSLGIPELGLSARDTKIGETFCELACLFVLHLSLFPDRLDKKLLRTLWGFHRKIPVVVLYGNALWSVDEFISRFLSAAQLKGALDRRSLSQPQQQRGSLVSTGLLQKEVEASNNAVSAWLVSLDSWAKSFPQTDLGSLVSRTLLLQGFTLAASLSMRVRMQVALHTHLSHPMKVDSAVGVAKILCLISSIRYVLTRKYSTLVAAVISESVDVLSASVRDILRRARVRVFNEGVTSPRQVDTASALLLAENIFESGPLTRNKRLVFALTLCVAKQGKTFTDDEAEALAKSIRTMEGLLDLKKNLDSVSDGSCLLWHRVLISTFFRYVLEHPVEANKLQPFMSLLPDCLKTLRTAHHVADSELLVKNFQLEVVEEFKEGLLNPVCRDIETELRLQIHSHLAQGDRNPFSNSKSEASPSTADRDLRPILELDTLEFLGQHWNIKAFVGHYLDKNFYNLTTVALHDWRSYGEMRTLAYHKYGLGTVDPQLPSQTLEQGLDVLEIMRNIQIFVAKYAYNLNCQFFVERSSQSKHLNTIGIRQIGNSIRTHGAGIMNTAVNFTYQFLRKKFRIFSEFLYDDHIKSRLIKIARSVRELSALNDTTKESPYSFDQAEKFNRGIRRLGVAPDGSSYLDQFRLLITQIGNALGYVRMIRSGGLHCCSKAAAFIPDLDGVTSFEALAKEANLPEESVAASKLLDDAIGNISRNFAEGTAYFKLLVDVFVDAFQDQRNAHLKNFFVIVPPLTLNFVEHLIASKERMGKQKKDGALFCDDGFAMGIAYILTLLQQHSDFKSLHWVPTVSEKYRVAKREVRRQQGQLIQGVGVQGNSDDAKNKLQTLTLSLQRYEMYEQEFQLLFFNLNSARIFFHGNRS
ncbi:unnamed protein product, partial [Cyprideis torosa]